MSEEHDLEDGMNRRNILQAVGTTGAAIAGVTGIAGATSSDHSDARGVPSAHLETVDDDAVRAYQPYVDDESMVEQAFDDHIDSVAPLMESIGVSVPSSLDEAENLNVAPEKKDGQATAHIVAQFEGDEEVLFHVYPQADRAYAYVMNGDESKLLDPANGVETAGCSYTHTCDCPSSCGWYMGYEKKYSVCQLPDGTVSKEFVNGHCGCDDSPNPCT